MGLKDLLDAAKEKTGGFGSEKLAELAQSVNDALPVVTQAGFVIERIEMTLGVPPKAMVRARVERELTDQEYDALVERVGEQVVSSIVAGTFLKAAAFHRSFRIGTMRSSQVEIELSPLPAVRLLFTPAETSPIATGELPEIDRAVTAGAAS